MNEINIQSAEEVRNLDTVPNLLGNEPTHAPKSKQLLNYVQMQRLASLHSQEVYELRVSRSQNVPIKSIGAFCSCGLYFSFLSTRMRIPQPNSQQDN